MLGIGNKKINQKGMTLLEALVSTAIIGIGFVAVFQMVNYSVRSIDVSGERTKASYLVSMVAEDLISDKHSEKSDKKFMNVFFLFELINFLAMNKEKLILLLFWWNV